MFLNLEAFFSFCKISNFSLYFVNSMSNSLAIYYTIQLLVEYKPVLLVSCHLTLWPYVDRRDNLLRSLAINYAFLRGVDGQPVCCALAC